MKTILLTVLIFVWSGVSHAGETQVAAVLDSRIVAVTVYADRAVVEREAQLQLEPGSHQLRFDPLPEPTVEDSIQVSGTGRATITDVVFSTQYFAETPDEAVKAIHLRAQHLEDEIRIREDAVNRIDLQIDFVKRISQKVTAPTEESEVLELDPEKWERMVDFHGSRLAQLDAEKLKLEIEIRDLEAQQEQVEQEIFEAETQETKARHSVTVSLDVAQAGPVTLKLSYAVMGPSWFPTYDVRVQREQRSMALTYHGQVRQSTGEDWTDVAISLSTADLRLSGKSPELSPWHLSLVPPETPAQRRARRDRSKMANTMQQMIEPVQEYMTVTAEPRRLEPDLEVIQAHAQATTTAMMFQVAGRNTIESDNQRHKVMITQLEYPAYFRYSAVPKIDAHVYLKARATHESEFAILPGPAHIFLDQQFVATSRLDRVSPGETFWVFLGVDAAMSVNRKKVKAYESDEGVFTKKRKMIYEYLIEITNNKKTEEELVLWDQLPISNHEDIVVKLIQPPWNGDTDTLKKNEHEFLEWLLRLKPGETRQIPFQFSVEHPKEVPVYGLD